MFGFGGKPSVGQTSQLSDRCRQRTVANGKKSPITGQLRYRDAWQRLMSRPDGSVPSRPPLNSFERSRSIPENPTQKRGVFGMSLRRNSSHKDADGNAIERDLFRPRFPSVPLCLCGSNESLFSPQRHRGTEKGPNLMTSAPYPERTIPPNVSGERPLPSAHRRKRENGPQSPADSVTGTLGSGLDPIVQLGFKQPGGGRQPPTSSSADRRPKRALQGCVLRGESCLLVLQKPPHQS